MPNLRGASPDGRDGRDHSYAAQTGGRSRSGWRHRRHEPSTPEGAAKLVDAGRGREQGRVTRREEGAQ